MNTKTLIQMLALLTLILGVGSLNAQEDRSKGKTPVKETVDRFRTTLDSLSARLGRGEISEQEFEDGVEAAARMMGDSIVSVSSGKKVIVITKNDKDGKMEKELEEMIEEELEEAFSKDDKDNMDGFKIETQTDSSGNRIKIKIDGKPIRRTTPFFVFNFGPTIPLAELAPAVPEFEPWRSWTVNMGVLGSTRIGGPKSWFHINYGVKFKFLSLQNKQDLMVQVVDRRPQFTPFNGDVRRLSFNRYSMDLPVQIRLAGPKKNSLNVILGGYGGIRLDADQQIRFRSAAGERGQLRLRDDYRTTLWHYGLTAAIGQRWWQLYADYEMNPLFKENYIYHILNTGVQFSF